LDLSRAKTILIICFLLLNLFLAGRLWQFPRYIPAGALTTAEVEQARQALAEAGYGLETAIPRQVPRLALLHVTRRSLNAAEWQRLVFGAAETEKSEENGKTVFLWGKERLEIEMDGRLVFSRPATVPGGEEAAEDSRQAVENFLRARGFWQEDFKFDLSFPGGAGTNYYRYVQTFQRMPLFAAYVKVRVTDGIIREVRISWLQPLEFSGHEVRVISAQEALIAFIGKGLPLPDRRVVDITLGYFSQDYDASRWTIAPAWRITSADGRMTYINAFTGELERQE
jgi:hypothetical protein